MENQKLDLRKELKHLYNPTAREFAMVDVPAFNFLRIDGKGNPNTSLEYRAAVETLYALAYALKFAVRSRFEVDYPVMPLEGLWWVEDMRLFSAEHKEDWLWSMMILQPEMVTRDLVEEVCQQTAKKKDLPALPLLRFESYLEGLSVQIMHFGPYADEAPTLKRMHTWIREQGFVTNGKHHEIYLGDPRRSTPDKLKTVLRQPICKA